MNSVKFDLRAFTICTNTKCNNSEALFFLGVFYEIIY